MTNLKLMLSLTGLGLIVISLSLFGLIFYPVIAAEVQYLFNNDSPNKAPVISREEFEITIPEINLKAQVFPDIDPFNKTEYLKALSKGVAHAKDSALPGETGNVFIFAHSTDLPVNVTPLNAVFYLINKLKPGDEINLSYLSKNYKYIVEGTKIVNSKEVNYLQEISTGRTLTLMTCWPPGTTLKRLLIISRLAQ